MSRRVILMTAAATLAAAAVVLPVTASPAAGAGSDKTIIIKDRVENFTATIACAPDNPYNVTNVANSVEHYQVTYPDGTHVYKFNFAEAGTYEAVPVGGGATLSGHVTLTGSGTFFDPVFDPVTGEIVSASKFETNFTLTLSDASGGLIGHTTDHANLAPNALLPHAFEHLTCG